MNRLPLGVVSPNLGDNDKLALDESLEGVVGVDGAILLVWRGDSRLAFDMVVSLLLVVLLSLEINGYEGIIVETDTEGSQDSLVATIGVGSGNSTEGLRDADPEEVTEFVLDRDRDNDRWMMPLTRPKMLCR